MFKKFLIAIYTSILILFFMTNNAQSAGLGDIFGSIINPRNGNNGSSVSLDEGVKRAKVHWWSCWQEYKDIQETTCEYTVENETDYPIIRINYLDIKDYHGNFRRLNVDYQLSRPIQPGSSMKVKTIFNIDRITDIKNIGVDFQ